ncbi:MAG: group 1 truncated hemoglobin [Terriglobia bacterium]
MNKTSWKFTCIFVLTSLTPFFGLKAAEGEKSLYDRLGGKPAVQAVAGGLVDSILLDNRVNGWFAHAASSPANATAYKEKLAEFICQNTGGPCKYPGQDMVTAHKGRGVTSEAFDAVVQDLVAVLEKFKVPEREKNELLGILGPLKTSIVQH